MFISAIKKTVLITTCTLISIYNVGAYSKVVPLTSCLELAKPKTVLVVHATWCHFCQDYMPKYTQVSNDPEFKDWTFYQKIDNDFSPVCGKTIRGVPITYKDNMNKSMGKGDGSVEDIKNFLRSSGFAISNHQTLQCKQRKQKS